MMTVMAECMSQTVQNQLTCKTWTHGDDSYARSRRYAPAIVQNWFESVLMRSRAVKSRNGKRADRRKPKIANGMH
jgi:hypothetical protein